MIKMKIHFINSKGQKSSKVFESKSIAELRTQIMWYMKKNNLQHIKTEDLTDD